MRGGRDVVGTSWLQVTLGPLGRTLKIPNSKISDRFWSLWFHIFLFGIRIPDMWWLISYFQFFLKSSSVISKANNFAFFLRNSISYPRNKESKGLFKQWILHSIKKQRHEDSRFFDYGQQQLDEVIYLAWPQWLFHVQWNSGGWQSYSMHFRREAYRRSGGGRKSYWDIRSLLISRSTVKRFWFSAYLRSQVYWM